MISRRSFLSRSGIIAATAGAGMAAPHVARSADDLLSRAGQKPRKVILIVSDGMSIGTLTCADQFSLATRDRELEWMKLGRVAGAHHGLMSTRSLNSWVTDSAAAASAWGSGSRVANGAINMLPDGRLLTPIYPLLAREGWALGLVTTAEITHATPAGFVAATRSRQSATVIADQYLEQKVDVLLGGGRPFFDALKRRDKRDLRGDFRAAGYAVVQDAAGLAAAPTDRPILGTFADGHLPYTLDHGRDAKLRAAVPTLAKLTEAALARLERREKFFLQVEGARIDHAAHNSDAAAAIHDQLALDEAIEVCRAFQQRHPDTLLIVTTDHGNANLGLNGMGSSYRHSSQRFAALGAVKASFPEILKQIQKVGESIRVPAIPRDVEDELDIPDPMAKAGAKPIEEEQEEDAVRGLSMVTAIEVSPKAIRDIVAETTGYRMSPRRSALFARVLSGDYQALYDQMNGPVTQLGQVLANHLGIGWTGNTHTSDLVPIVALGPGAEQFRGQTENIDFFSICMGLAEIDFKNPDHPVIAADGPEAHEVEGIAGYALADGTRLA